MNHWKDFSTAAILTQWATGTQRIRVLLLCSFLIISSIKSGSGADFLNFLGQPLLNTDQQRLAGNWVNLDIIESYFFVSANVDLLDEEMLTLNTPSGSSGRRMPRAAGSTCSGTRAKPGCFASPLRDTNLFMRSTAASR